MRILRTNILLIAWCTAFLVHFCMIAVQGQVLIQEPNPFILGYEIAIVVASIGFGIYNLVKFRRD